MLGWKESENSSESSVFPAGGASASGSSAATGRFPGPR